MGVHGLETFIAPLFINECITDVAYSSTGTPRTIICDASGVLNYLQVQHCDYVFGDVGRLYEETLAFIDSLKPFHLVFVFDGISPLSKNERKSASLQKKLSSLSKLRVLALTSLGDMHASLYASADDSNKLVPSGIEGARDVIRIALCEARSRGRAIEIVQADGEADPMIAALCIQRDAYGVLAKDSDFVVYNLCSTKYLYLPSISVKQGKMFIDALQVATVAKRLNLYVGLLPLFACLCGTEKLSATDLTPFWNARDIIQSGEKTKKYPSIDEIAKFVRTLQHETKDKTSFSLSADAARQLALGKVKEQFMGVLHEYNIEQISTILSRNESVLEWEGVMHELPRRLLAQFRRGDFSLSLLTYLITKKYHSGLRLGSFVYAGSPYLLRPLRERLYRCLFNEQTEFEECLLRPSTFNTFLDPVSENVSVTPFPSQHYSQFFLDEPAFPATIATVAATENLAPITTAASVTSGPATLASQIMSSTPARTSAPQDGADDVMSKKLKVFGNVMFGGIEPINLKMSLLLCSAPSQLALLLASLKHLLMLGVPVRDIELLLATSLFTATGFRNRKIKLDCLKQKEISILDLFWSCLRTTRDVNAACGYPFPRFFETHRRFRNQLFYEFYACGDLLEEAFKKNLTLKHICDVLMKILTRNELPKDSIDYHVTELSQSNIVGEFKPRLLPEEMKRRAQNRFQRQAKESPQKLLAESSQRLGKQAPSSPGASQVSTTKYHRHKLLGEETKFFDLGKHLRYDRFLQVPSMAGAIAYDRAQEGPCKHFVRQGRCSHGKECRFSHDERARTPCSHYFIHGKCGYFADCRFSHHEIHRAAALKSVSVRPSYVAPGPPLEDTDLAEPEYWLKKKPSRLTKWQEW